MPRLLVLVGLALLAVPAFAQLPPDKALATMKAGDGLQVELFAHEPMLINPTSIDVDHLGRVWVAEAVNYRRKNFGRPMLREAGDRIQVLIDEKGEGKATKAVTFYQGKDLYGPLSVCVIPVANPDRKVGGTSLRVLVAQSPDILEFTCKDASNPVADGPPKKFLTGFGGFDHDHGVHGLHLGPDGKLYFTVGDSGVTGLQSSDGKGKKWVSNSTDVQKGTVWRCDLDGKNVELIAHNFRNNYEACVDSFGEIWLSDNDDDGNQQTRICFVMPGGNYGYGPRGPGQSHWHEEQPGIVHKTLRTGFGSPCGIQFYEGNLLPKQYHNTLMHADAGPREIRAFTRKPKGAGYELDKTLMLTSTDTWYRPSDVCTAPDGSVFVCDWYDPGVGGHGMGDHTRGRIYRLTPTGHKGYKVPEVKLDTREGVLAALDTPNVSSRETARKALPKLQRNPNDKEEIPTTTDARLRARIYWVAAESILASEFNNDQKLKSASFDGIAWVTPTEQLATILPMLIRCDQVFLHGKTELTLKVPRKGDIAPDFLGGLAYARETLIHYRGVALNDMLIQEFYAFAKLYDGQDIFYRAALNIACGTDPVRRDALLADFEKHFPEWNDKVADLVWELRPKSMLPKMEKLLADAKLTGTQKARIVDILAVNPSQEAGKTLLNIVNSDLPSEVKTAALGHLVQFLPTKWNALATPETIRPVVEQLLAANQHSTAMQLAPLVGEAKMLDVILNSAKDRPERIPAIATALAKIGTPAAVEKLKIVLMGAGYAKVDPVPVIQAIGQVIAKSGNQPAGKEALAVLQSLIDKSTDRESLELMRSVFEALAGSRVGTQWLLAQKEANQLPPALDRDVGRLLRNSPFQGERNKAMLLFPAPGKLDPKKLPPITELVKRTGNANNGKALLAKSLTGESQCMKCHMVRGQGGSIGPDLSLIGKKASKENLYDSLFTPSKAIADQYASWKLDGEDGQSITGLIVGETETTITVRDANGKDYQFPVKGTERKKVLTSLMPDNLLATFTEEELIDLVEYLMTLKTASLTPESWHVAGPYAADGDAALDKDFGPEKGAVDLGAKYGGVAWRTVRPANTGNVDLAALHGDKAVNSVSYLYRVIESPIDQEATVLLGTDDGCRLFVNGEKVFGHERHEAAAPERDSVKVKLKKGANTILLKVNNGSLPHGFYFTLTSAEELKAK